MTLISRWFYFLLLLGPNPLPRCQNVEESPNISIIQMHMFSLLFSIPLISFHLFTGAESL